MKKELLKSLWGLATQISAYVCVYVKEENVVCNWIGFLICLVSIINFAVFIAMMISTELEI